MIILVPAQSEHVLAMAGRYRQADVEEFQAGWDQTVERGAMLGLTVSRISWAGIWKERVIAVCGLYQPTALPDVGVPWMVGTTDLEDTALRKEFLRTSRMVLKHFLTARPKLENYVDARNTTAVRWLRWLGFTIHPAEPYGIAGLPFHRFTMEA